MKSRHAALGLTLVELLVGLAMGLFVVAATATALAAHGRDSRRLLLAARVQQDLRATADLVVRELRRSGRWRDAESAVWAADLPASAASNPHGAIAGLAPGSARSTATVSYDRDRDGRSDATGLGFQLRRGAVEMRIGDGAWQQLTDPALLTVTRFDLVLRRRTLDLGRFCALPCPASTPACGPAQQVHEVDVHLEAHAIGDATLHRTVQAAVRPRADAIDGACPA